MNTKIVANNFQYFGGDMTKTEPLIGIKRFSQIFTAMRVKQVIVEGNTACVIGNYDLKFPNGQELNGNVAELWTTKNGKLQSLIIYFDTLTFANKTKR